MTAAALLAQRSRGLVTLRFGCHGLVDLREEGSAKLRLPRGSREAILINTGGGLAGGDDFAFDLTVEADASLAVTTQAAERVYRSLGPPAAVRTRITAGADAVFAWLPQETILYDGAALTRRLDADLEAGARFLAVEPLLFGRAAHGEDIRSAKLRDCWRIRRNGRLIFADDAAFSGARPASAATLANALAMATVVLIAVDAERYLDPARALLDGSCGISAWNGKLVARLTAVDGLALRKVLVPLLVLLSGGVGLPKVWSI